MNSSTSRWLLGALLGVAGGFVLGSASCAAMSATGAGGTGGSGSVGTGYTSTGVGGDAAVISPDGDIPPKRLTFADLCGMGPCVPGPSGDVGCQQGAGGGSSSTSSGTGGSTTSTGSTGSGGAGVASLDCQITPTGSTPTSVCAAVGTGALNAPCQSSSDCGPGLGCASDGAATQPSVALCRPYCCGDFEDCPAHTFCAKEPMAENPSRNIPVCMPVTPCQLLTDGACAADQTCSIVRADGTASCVTKGVGQFCQACPCAAGFTCSATGICQKICHTSAQGNGECGLGTCQGGSMNLPSGIGLCVGGEADCSHKL